jgi:hypothetical protein
MNTKLAKHLWSSPSVRSALKKEALRLLLFIALYVGTSVVIRYVREKPIQEGIYSATLGMVFVALAWFLSCARTIRAVLREHSLLDR